MRPVGFERAQPLRIWAVSDGRPGHANQALGLAEAIARRTAARVEAKRIRLRTPHSWLPPRLVAAPQAALAVDSDGLSAPWPDIWIGCGRQTAPFGMALRTWSERRSLTVQLQNPRVNPREFDLVLAPSHDGLESPHVTATCGALHRITPERLAEAAALRPDLAALPSPRLAVLIGGASKRQTISPKRAQGIAADLLQAHRTGASLLVTLSRRTPEGARRVLDAALQPRAALWYDGAGENPYLSLLAVADHVVVTADSVSMAAEAASTGVPVHVLPVDGQAGKLARYHDELQRRGAARPFRLPLAGWTYPPIRETDRCAELVLNAFREKAKRA